MDAYEKDIRNYIDFVKAVAVMQIIFWHFDDARGLSHIPLPDIFMKLSSMDIHETARGMVSAFSYYGHIANNLFFIVSGFGLYLSFLTNHQSWREFYLKRIVRIIPIYWAAAIFIYYLENGTISFKSFISHMLMVQIFTPDYLDFTSLWFIGVLVWFYIFFPLFVKLFSTPASKWTLIIFSFLCNALLVKTLDILGYSFQGRLPTAYLQFFIFGMLVADLLVNNKALLSTLISLRGGLIVSALLTASIVLHSAGITALDDATAQCLAYFVALYIPAILVGKSSLLKRITAFVALSSFIAFLIHHAIFKLLLTYLIKNQLVTSISHDNLHYIESQATVTMLMIPTAVAVILFSGLAQAYYNRYVRGNIIEKPDIYP